MLDLISLELKCPLCHASLMDKKNPVDNKPGIKLNISLDGKKGTIWLSSIYNSYNFSSDLEIKNNSVAEFSCPHCKQRIISEEKCSECGAPIIPLHLIEGGKVTICSRAGCKKHSITIEDLKTALSHFYRDFSYDGNKKIDLGSHENIYKPRKTKEAEEKEIIKSGSYLHSFCPHCKKTLIENNHLILAIEKDNGETGHLILSPFLNVFTHKSTIHLPEKQTVKDIKCWHCETSLIEKEKKCPECGSEIARISVAANSKMIDFYICSKKGCTWHGLSDEDIESIMIEDSEEW